jgi:hypothetical protein
MTGREKPVRKETTITVGSPWSGGCPWRPARSVFELLDTDEGRERFWALRRVPAQALSTSSFRAASGDGWRW